MTAEIISVLAAFAPQFTQPTWKNIQTLFLGAVLCRGARRVTSILRFMGLAKKKKLFDISQSINPCMLGRIGFKHGVEIQRTTPLLMAIRPILTLVAIKMNDAKTMLVHETTS